MVHSDAILLITTSEFPELLHSHTFQGKAISFSFMVRYLCFDFSSSRRNGRKVTACFTVRTRSIMPISCPFELIKQV